MTPRPRLLASLLIVTALVTVAYWVNYYTAGDVKTVDARWYTAFEDAFPAADGWLAATALAAGIGFWTGRPWAGAMSLLAGSALLYLAGMDIAFDIENGLYGLVPQSSAMQFELTINVWSLLLGIWAVGSGWIHSQALRSGTISEV